MKSLKIIYLLNSFFIGALCFSQQSNNRPPKESFEKETSILNFKKDNSSKLSISDKHHQFGKSSLQWEWSKGGFFETSNFRLLTKKESPLSYGDYFPSSPTLVMSLYNEKAQNETIKVLFGKNGADQVWFPIKLNFTGWRTIRVPFFEMSGNPPKKGEAIDYDVFKVSSSSTTSKGKLFFDDIVFSQYMDDRHPYPDAMVPFIKRDKQNGEDHWMPLIVNMKRIHNLPLKPVSENQKKDLNRIEKRLNDIFSKNNTNKSDNLSKAKKEYDNLNLVKGETVLGPPLTYAIQEVYFDKEDVNQKEFKNIGDFGKSLKQIAFYYQQSLDSNKAQIEEMFINASRYFLDQGWQEWASGGTRHHVGYALGDLADAFYIMKEPLKKAGLLNEVGNSLQWVFNLGQILEPENEFKANIDYYNTQSFFHLKLIFMSDNVEKQSALLKNYSNYISKTLALDNESGVFKIDGTSWHHDGHYPAYGMGAFTSLPSVIFTLSQTQYRINEAGHKNFKKALLTTRLYSQLLDYGFGNAGRHPLVDNYNSIRSLKTPYLLMARSGNPEGSEKIDKEVAAAYIRLWGDSDKANTDEFEKKYTVGKDSLPGYHVLPYAATAIHRRKDWATIIKGYSKYVWASEIYVDANRYGRYPANGSIQLNNKGGDIASGFKEAGWDWNRFPGTTVINLPFKELEPKTELLMFTSNETFAGAVTLGNNGVFGMKLNESKGSDSESGKKSGGFPGRLKANKSVFSFGDKLICIGTGISSTDTEHPVETNLFQNYIADKSMPIFSSEKATISDFPYQSEMEGNSGKWLIDAYQNGYYILTPNKIEIRRQNQESYNNEYSINNGTIGARAKGNTVTHGDYASSWIEHGKAPVDASYQYVIYPGLQKDAADTFEMKVKNDKSYEILRADNVAHIVKDNETMTTGFVIFDSSKELDDAILKSVSVPSLLMVKNETDTLTISAVQPDLNFSSSKGISGYSMPVELTIILKGNWKLKNNSVVKSILVSDNNTVITLECRHGFSNQIDLKKS